MGLMGPMGLSAQSHEWSLRECCDYAVSHNIGIRQKANVERQQDIQLSTALNSRLPNVNLSAGETFSFGRAQTLDGTYSNRNTNNASFSLGTSVPLFTGFRIPNQIKLNQLNLDAATQDLEKARNDIRMQVAKAYVQILYDMEMADVAHRQITIDSAQVARLQAFVQNGKASQAELSQQQATLAKSHLTATRSPSCSNCPRPTALLLSVPTLLTLPTVRRWASRQRPSMLRLSPSSRRFRPSSFACRVLSVVSR